MTQEIAEHLRKLSSRNGRYWLRDSRHPATGAVDTAEQLPFGSVKGKEQQGRNPMHESVVVSIPDVTTQTVKVPSSQMTAPAVTQTVVASQQLDTRVAAAHAMQKVPQAPHSFSRAALKAEMPELAPVATSQSANTVAMPQQAIAAASTLVSASEFSTLEATEIVAQPAPVPSTQPAPPVPVADPQPKEDDAVKAARATQSNEMESSIVKIADEIVANYPVASASVIMLTGSQSALHADETCARVAAELASRNLGRVLLVDSDFESRRLTKASGMSSQGGLSEIMNIAFPWKDAILKSGSSKLDFMAAGNCPHKRWTPKRLLREALAEIRNDYQFVCVSAGDAHGSAAALWSELSDGALLVVSASQSSEAIAQSAVGQLKANGARMLGCVVADCG